MSFAKNQSDKPEDRWIDGMGTTQANSRFCYFALRNSIFKFDLMCLQLDNCALQLQFTGNSMFPVSDSCIYIHRFLFRF